MSNDEEILNIKEKARSLLPALKEELADLAKNVEDENLLKFLHWKQDVQRAAERFRAHVSWRKDNPWAFDNLRVSEDEQLKKVVKGEIMVAPESLASKNGEAVLVGRLRNNDMSDGRTPQDVSRSFFYLIDRVLEREEAQLNGVIIFHDLAGLSKNNLHPTIPRLVLKGILGHFPIRIKGIYLLNPPWFFNGFFAVIKNTLFPKKLKQRMFNVDGIEDIYEVIDKEKLLEEHGGNLQHDNNAYVEEQCAKEKDTNGQFRSLSSCV